MTNLIHTCFISQYVYNNNNNNNNNNNKLQVGCHLVEVVILHVYKILNLLLTYLLHGAETFLRS